MFATKTTDLWIGASDGTRLKVSAPGTLNWRPSWMPDGRTLTFVSVGDLAKDAQDVAMYRTPADGSVKASLLQRQHLRRVGVRGSHDGTWLVTRADETGGDQSRSGAPTDG